MRGIPGSRLPKVVQTAQWARDPVGHIERCRRRYGPVFTVRFFGLGDYVYVTDPALARDVYAGDRTVGRAGEARGDFLTPLVGEHSLLVSEGDEWLRHRKLLGPVFHRSHVESYADEIAEIAAEGIARWPRGAPFALRPRMQEITLEVILRLVFGLAEGERHDRLRELLPALGDGLAGPLVGFMPPGLLRRRRARALLQRFPNPIGRFFALRDEIDALIYAEIADRRAHGAGDRRDVLSLLLPDMGDRELRDELITLLEAGHETTATALSWAFERLVRHPDVLARAREGDDEYLDAVVREALRTRPVVPDTPRRLAGPLTVGDRTIPAGAMVTVAITSVQLDPAAAAEPERFRPERFLEAPVRDGWLPFGGGKRHCVGSHLALLEMRVIMREALRRVAFETTDAPSERQRMHHVTLTPSKGALVVSSA